MEARLLLLRGIITIRVIGGRGLFGAFYVIAIDGFEIVLHGDDDIAVLAPLVGEFERFLKVFIIMICFYKSTANLLLFLNYARERGFLCPMFCVLRLLGFFRSASVL